jgi:hypothetical protein
VSARKIFNRRHHVWARDTGAPLPRCRTDPWTEAEAPLSAGLFMSQRTPRRRSSFDLARIFLSEPCPCQPLPHRVGGTWAVPCVSGEFRWLGGLRCSETGGRESPASCECPRYFSSACQAGQVRCRSRVLTVVPATMQHHF